MERGRMWGKGVVWYTYYIHIYVSGKIRLVETIPGKEGSRIKENDGGDEFNYDIL
jgi:hypothetical protein